MKLSVIIVNYNVKHFIEQCLISVFNAMKRIDGDVYVVDNNSVDGSNEMILERFPDVKLIANKENVGFSKANNQAMRDSKAEYVLLLNPDTVIEEDTLEKVVDFMDEHPDAGGLGVKMIDGKGVFLPESKRALPSPSVAFYKIFGLSALFPKSKRFARYHLGFLDNNETHEVEILSGAFMLMRKSALDKVGFLDETFFMYGEDIDLSYRLILGGYKNYYYPKTSIIHYKGESTKKSSVNYVFVFYRAMVIFAQKHFSQKNARLFSFLINSAIYLRAFWAIVMQTIKKTWLYVFDFLLLGIGLFFITKEYGQLANIDFKPEVVTPALIAYPITWILSNWYAGGYDQPMSKRNIFKGVFSGTIVVLIIYSLIPETLRFSRAVVLMSALFGSSYYWLSRALFTRVFPKQFVWKSKFKKHFLVVANENEQNRITSVLSKTNIPIASVTKCYPDIKNKLEGFAGNLSQWEELIQVHNIDEVIFSAENLSPNQIMDLMVSTKNKSIDFKIAPPDSLYIIGSNSIHNSGETYMVNANAISKPINQRKKRSFDVLISLLLIITFPLTLFLVKHPLSFFNNCWLVLLSKKTWVGFDSRLTDNKSIPNLKKGVIFPSIQQSLEEAELTNLTYAKDYRTGLDFQLLAKHFNKLGNRH